MVALASLTNWIPEDDLLLKNAVEAGASLESLAKGAVRFSRRYTIKELQDRWRSLLYDLNTSLEASARIIEREAELPVANAPKTNRLSSFKGKETPGKRKGDSVRSHYYAIRKRICSEPHSSADLGCMQPSSLLYNGYTIGCQQCLNSHITDVTNHSLTVVSSKLQEPSLDHYKHLENLPDNAPHNLSNMVMVDTTADNGTIASNPFHMDSIDDDFAHGIADNGCIFENTENVMPSVDKFEGDSVQQPFEHDFGENDVPQIVGEHVSYPNICHDAQEVGPPQPQSANGINQNDVMKPRILPDLDSSVGDHERLHPGFDGDNGLVSQLPECCDSFHQLAGPSPHSHLPIWTAVDDISAPTSAIDGHFEHNQGANELLGFHDVKEVHSPVCHGNIAETELNDNSKMIAQSDYMDIGYLNFMEDDLLLINVDEKDITDSPSPNALNSILLSSPTSTHHDDVCNSSEVGVTNAVGMHPTSPDGVHTRESNDFHEEIYPDDADEDIICVSGVNEPSTSLKVSNDAESSKSSMVCVLNTEDPEVPCNDDVPPPAQFASSSPCDMEHNPIEKPTFVSASFKPVDDEKTNMQNFASSMKTGSPNVGLMLSSRGCKMEPESINSETRVGVYRHAGNPFGDPTYSISISAKKQETVAMYLGKHCNFDSALEKLGQGSNLAELRSSNMASKCKQESDIQDALLESELYATRNSDEISIEDQEKNMSKLYQGDHFSDSEDDVPSYSDIEAMILDMDLGPHDQDSCLFTKEVSRYQCSRTKKAIIKLEQGAHSYMQRAMAYHGAFAILYGRRLKYYIKSPKVSLGRATEGVKVDIDLGREGRTKKISRRQAILKMEEDGSFFLTNVGKGSIFINSKEVPPEKRTTLTSGCLIEIRGMRFIFEVNQAAVRHHISNLQGKKEEERTKFD